MTADDIIRAVVREVIAAIRLGRRIDRHVPTATLAAALERATYEAAGMLPSEPIHLGAVYERRWTL